MPETATNRLLQIYLDDHWAGAGAGKALMKRLRNHAPTKWRDDMTWMVRQIEEDEKTLKQLRRRLDLRGAKTKRILALAAEKLVRFKPNGDALSYTPLNRLLDTESMIMGVAGKHRLWAALGNGESPVTPGAFDFADLEARAADQLDLLYRFHQDIASAALADGTTHPAPAHF